MQHIRRILLVVVLTFAFSGLYAINPPPANDTVCEAIDLGVLPVPGPCPSYPYGDTLQVSGTTDWATMNSFDFSPVSCFPNGSPDVWYKFRSTGNYIYIELFGSGGLDTMFCKLYTSQGSCLGLIPGHCETTFNGTIMAAILTPDIGGEYYLQIGGGQWYETGNFFFSIKSFNDCSDCVKNSHVTMDPAPWFGRYGTSDTVTMCYTVDRWDQTTTSKLHAVVPEFGDEWDTTTLVPVSFPSTGTGWIWGNNITTPIGAYDGFYFDGNFNGNPTDNPGESSNITTSWEFCWSIATKPFCNAYDAHVQIFTFSDNQTGNGNSAALCNEAVPINMTMSGWCCPDPIITINNTGTCITFASVTVDPVSPSSTDTFNITVYDDSLDVYAYTPNITTGTALFTLPEGVYVIEVHNATANCPSFHIVTVPGAFEIELEQTVVGCDSSNGSSAVATPSGGQAPYTYVWPGITSYTDSLAFNLSEGFQVVQITDGMGCTVLDSIFISELPAPGADFAYGDFSYCSNDDTIQVYVQPYTPGGQYQLMSPLTAGITINPTTGTISLNNTTLSPPFIIKVRYTVGTACIAVFVDSVQIHAQPAQPIPTVSPNVDWCIGSTVPSLGINIGVGLPLWYDVQTSQTGFGYTMTPPLGQSSVPGLYLYGFQYFSDLTFGCGSVPTIFTLSAHELPIFTPSAGLTICPDDTAMLTVTGFGPLAYSWSPNPTLSPNFGDTVYTSPTATTIYTVSASNAYCIDTRFVIVFVDNASNCTGLAITNGITPNGDGHNDTWVIDGAALATNMTVCIYNRWGFLMWKGNNYNNTTVVWKGDTQSGEALPAGTYYYTIELDNSGPTTGWIELNR